jgi:fused signal recognition particle receptor
MFDSLRKKLSDAIKGIVKKEAQSDTKATEVLQEATQEAKEIQHHPNTDAYVAVGKNGASGTSIKESNDSLGASKGTTPKPGSENKESQKQNPYIIHKDAESKAANNHERNAPEPKKEEPLLKTSIGTKIKGTIFGSVKLSDTEINDFSEKVKISLLESEVSYDAADDISYNIKENLDKKQINMHYLESELKNTIRESLSDVLEKMPRGIDLVHTVAERINEGRTPVRILFLGPNGTGKTTTMAKIAHMLKGAGITSVFSASDTFRAAAIEQTEIHANRLGIPVIKSKYGSDPASVAFDAIAYASAHSINTVLIDSAGRQETNKNLVNELHKMVRVAKPDIVIFVGESTAGNNLTDQIIEFKKVVKIDGIVLTKLDCDAKGGNAISIAKLTGVPILFFGTGEKYDAMVPYSPQFLIDSILPN